MKERVYAVHVQIDFGEETMTLRESVRALSELIAVAKAGVRIGRRFRDIRIIMVSVTEVTR